ncbi:hypothetical protein [Candidatus Formimonas warabiya]|uniref:Uncharacterized protein n=1 Tax=Formimonas warabiya TaxID=1761012 RepID=A0A3G1KSB7_FORW1|nr:hypothetical protein [Candidatus Formimonas warabiya]ATW25336.1 hypothetical protein DCMF_11650 [Candidatus Formimonas warabiya]
MKWGDGAIDILWIILLVLFWILGGAVKKNKPPRPQGQPWDQARRRQSVPPPVAPDLEEARPRGPFPPSGEMGDLEEEIRRLFGGDRSLPDRAVEERKKPARFKTLPRVRVWRIGQKRRQREKKPAPMVPKSTFTAGPRGNCPELCFNPNAVVQGVIMSEILQPPRAKRPFRSRINHFSS